MGMGKPCRPLVVEVGEGPFLPYLLRGLVLREDAVRRTLYYLGYAHDEVRRVPPVVPQVIQPSGSHSNPLCSRILGLLDSWNMRR